MHHYQIWAWAYIDGEHCEWTRNIVIANTLTEDELNDFAGDWADVQAMINNCNIALYGWKEIR